MALSRKGESELSMKDLIVYKVIYDLVITKSADGSRNTFINKVLKDLELVDYISKDVEKLDDNEVVKRLNGFTLLTQLINREKFRELKQIPYRELDHIQKQQISDFQHSNKIVKRLDTWQQVQDKLIGFRKAQRVFYNDTIKDYDVEYIDLILVRA